MKGGRKAYQIEWTAPQREAVEIALRLRIESLADARRFSDQQDGCDLEPERIEQEVLQRALAALQAATTRRSR